MNRAPSHVSLCRNRNHDRAGNGTRTRDPNLGKVVLYQLSYSRTSHVPTMNRIAAAVSSRIDSLADFANICSDRRPSGGEGNRTPDLLNAIQALSQLSYAPGSRWTKRTFPAGTANNSRGYM